MVCNFAGHFDEEPDQLVVELTQQVPALGG